MSTLIRKKLKALKIVNPTAYYVVGKTTKSIADKGILERGSEDYWEFIEAKVDSNLVYPIGEEWCAREVNLIEQFCSIKDIHKAHNLRIRRAIQDRDDSRYELLEDFIINMRGKKI